MPKWARGLLFLYHLSYWSVRCLDLCIPHILRHVRELGLNSPGVAADWALAGSFNAAFPSCSGQQRWLFSYITAFLLLKCNWFTVWCNWLTVLLYHREVTQSYICTFSCSFSLWLITGCWMELPVLYSGNSSIHSVYTSLRLLTPDPIPPLSCLPPPWQPQGCPLFLWFWGSFVSQFRFQLSVMSYGVCHSPSDLFHLVWWSLAASMLLQMA